ncbi:ribonuclease P protein component [Deinococcus sp. YIM 134068]|uniref:ribonuclease P protein component n=1 Tax=Deinococcus lichenicola TaxID=3118910 RepID=UPI003FA4A94A
MPHLSPPASLKGEREFRRVRQHGVALRDPLFTLRVTDYRPRHGETWRPRAIIGIVVSKKTLRRAVDRNRARRRVREALRTLPGGLPPCRAILLPNPSVLTAPFPELQSALARVLAGVPGRVKKGSGKGRGQTPAPRGSS